MNKDNTASSYSEQNQEPFVEKTWQHEKDFKDEATGICIRMNVSISPSKYAGGVALKQFSWELVRLKQNSTRVSRFFPVLMNVKNGKVILDDEPKLNVLNDLITEAKHWAMNIRQYREDEIMEARIEREKKEMGRGVQAQRPGLKQLGKMDRKE